MTLQGTSVQRHATLWLLGLVAFLNYVDRQAFSVVQDDIKAEFALNDTVLSLIAGPGFAIVYALAALPIARYADGSDRPRLIAGCLALWSLATAACGVVVNSWQLLMARMTLAVGESGSGPAAFSLLTDVFSEKRRTLVIGFMQAASSVGLSLGVILASLLAAQMNWRHVFITLGLPGVLLALIVWVFVLEPRRKGYVDQNPHKHVPLAEVIKIIAGNPVLRWVALLCIAAAMVGFSFLMWGPSFLRRVHGFEKAQLTWLGWAILVGLVSGNLIAGWLGDKFGSKNLKFNAIIAASGLLLAFPFTLGFVFLENSWAALACFVALKFFMTLWVAPTITMVFAIVPAGMRATMSALINMLIILAGIGFGTLVAGLMSDAYASQFGEESLRYSLATMTLGLWVAAFAAWRAGVCLVRSHGSETENSTVTP